MLQALSRIKYTVIIFVVLTAATVFSFVDVESQAQKPSNKFEEALRVELDLKKTKRNIASVNLNHVDLSENYFCNRKLSDKFAAKQMARVSFKLCGQYASAKTITVKNNNNGFKAQVIKIDKENFNTDYLQLTEGDNNVEFEFILKDGQIYRESLVIVSSS
jgi:hypothetical protein